MVTRSLAQPSDVVLSVVPSNADHRMAVVLSEAKILPGTFGVIGFGKCTEPAAFSCGAVRSLSECLPFAPCYVELASGKLADAYLPLWALSIEPARFIRGGAHNEATCRNNNHFGAVWAI